MRKYPFDPKWLSVHSVHNPWGDLCYELFKFSMPYPKGGGEHHNKVVTHSDLCPVGSTVYYFETDQTEFPKP